MDGEGEAAPHGWGGDWGEEGRLAERPSSAPSKVAAAASHVGRGIPETRENSQATARPRMAPLRISSGRIHRVLALSGTGSGDRAIPGSDSGEVWRAALNGSPLTKNGVGKPPHRRMAPPARLERATTGSEVQRSIQLSYGGPREGDGVRTRDLLIHSQAL